MLVSVSLMILIVITLFSVILGRDFIAGIANVAIDNEALVDGVPSTFFVSGQDVLFSIDTSNLIVAGISLIVAIIIVATITGITVLGSGLNPQSAKIIIILTGYIGIWSTLTALSFNLIIEIEVFGSIIYIGLTIAYIVGVIQKISGSDD